MKLARILHEAFGCERRKQGIFVSITEARPRMYYSTIRPRPSRINFALRARTFRTSTTLASKFRAICGLGLLTRSEILPSQCYGEPFFTDDPGANEADMIQHRKTVTPTPKITPLYLLRR